MVMHCDHFDSLRSCVRVYTDHIEFMNGGAFPLPVSNILGKIYSKLRNPTIAKLFRNVGIAENAGYGMNKLTSWEILTGTKPTIESDRTIATVTFPLKSAIQRITDSDNTDVAKNVAKNVTKNVAKNVAKKLTDRQQKIIALISANPQTTRAEIAAIIGVATKTIERELTSLSDIVRYVGSKKGGHWEIINYEN